MSLRNFHVDSNVSEAQLIKRAKGLYNNFIGSFRQAAANGHFTFAGITLKNGDLNRVHSIVAEINGRRLFYACGEDESPQHAMQSLYEARNKILQESKGIWADPSCEILVQKTISTLSKHCTMAEKLGNSGEESFSLDKVKFMQVMTDMRLSA